MALAELQPIMFQYLWILLEKQIENICENSTVFWFRLVWSTFSNFFKFLNVFDFFGDLKKEKRVFFLDSNGLRFKTVRSKSSKMLTSWW